MSKGTIPAQPEGYADWLTQVKGDITQARQLAALAVNAELVQLYHRLGGEIQQRQEQQNRLVAEYALSGIDKPIGVAEYQLLRDLPETLGRNLPSIAEIEAELAGELNTGSEVE
ncbi:hypothetical protein V0M98_28060 [Pseudomonas silesiensis]|uniref:hypothetical protein n=1 Tax=Pseudomonas silesiensis TaxID=1853130 RepID=UPI0030CE5239